MQNRLNKINDTDDACLIEDIDKKVKKFIDTYKTKRFEFGENSFVFEFERQTFMFATTELDKLFPPFRDRLTILDFEPYSKEELGKIMSKKISWVNFKDDVMTNIASTLRGNARSAIKRALEIRAYCEVHNQSDFGKNESIS